MNIEWWYCNVPNAVILDKRLTPNQKLLYWIISSLCAKKWYCRATNKYLWDLLWVKKISISNGISKLVECWYITIKWEYEKRTIALNVIVQWFDLSLLRDDEDDEDYKDERWMNNKKSVDKEEENNSNQLFDEFREKYPRKVWKKDAMKKFDKLKKEDQELAIKMIDVFKKTRQWQNEQYIPHPTTYINQERFRDEVETVSKEVDGKQSKYANDDRYIYDEKTWMYKLKPRMF